MRIHLVPNSHIDPVWLWDWREGFNEGLTTVKTVLNLMEEFPQLTFIRGEAAIYQHIEKTDPATFARLRNRLRVPDVRMLHEFRCQLNLAQLRRVNESLLLPLIEGTAGFPKTVALIDSTDLPAAANAYKKTRWASIVRSGRGLAAAAAQNALRRRFLLA